jgi:hypothetical protein
MSSDFCWVLNGGKKNSKRKAGVIENYFRTMNFFFTSYFFGSWDAIFFFFLNNFVHLPSVFLGLLWKKNSKFKTEETGVMETPLVHQALSFHFTNLSYCCERLVPSTCFELRTLDCCCWMMFLRGESNFSAYQILTRLKFNAYQILARTIF